MLIFRLFALLIFFTYSTTSSAAKVAIVIDDIGYRITDEQALNLPGNITFSVLPHTPFGKTLAEKAYRNNKEVLLHIPMESSIGKELGPGSLTANMNEQQIHNTLTLALNEVPFAIGINNHMGSKLTQLYKPMAATMQFLKQHKLLFLDSRTTLLSKGEQVAQEYGVPSLHRHVFLDNQLTDRYISKQFQQLIRIAKTKHYAVAIAHPHPESIKILTKLIPTLKKQHIEIVSLSQLIQQNQSTNLATSSTSE